MNTERLAIEVNNVYKSFKNVRAVQGINLHIPVGQFVALLGPNGAGKTTLVEMIEGIQKPDKGVILIMGKKWKGNEDSIHQMIGLSLQETRYIDKLTVRETLRMFASFYRLNGNRVEEMIELVGLQEKRKSYVDNLSGGQRQRLALGIALLNRPKILLLDEPTTGLDPNARREIWTILHKLKELHETSLILTTHYMEEAEQLCDYIIIIDHGKVLREGTLDQLMKNENDQKIIEFSIEGGLNQNALLKNGNPFKIEWNNEKDAGTIQLGGKQSDVSDFFLFLKEKDIQLKTLGFRKKTLDDVFIDLTGRHLNE